MKHLSESNVKYFSKPSIFYNSLIDDVSSAKKNIFIEMYKIEGSIARILRDVLVKKVKEGVDVRLLVDYWGSNIPVDFFDKITKFGGEIRFFREFKFTTNLFSYNNRRDHRKLVIVDDVSYIGSCNISDHCISWREFIVRVEDKFFADKLKLIFFDNFKIHNFFFHSVKRHLKPFIFSSLEFVRDVPSFRYQRARNKHLYYIRKARKKIIIETPYFIPDTKILFALIKAAKRDVDVKIIIPIESDVKIVDVLAQSLFGLLHRSGVKIYFHKSFNHSKVSLVDDKFFSFGSSNFDYRSFIYQYELCIFGNNSVFREIVKNHVDESLNNSIPFNYAKWKIRPWHVRLFEIIVSPFKRLF